MHNDAYAALFARQLIASLEEMGIHVFPDLNTCWHYDDKVGQKYLLEAIGAPLVPTHIFYDRAEALAWAETASFPKVWKLRGGAGSQNVRLVRTREQARRHINRSFGRGWGHDRFAALKERIWHLRRDRSWASFLAIARGVGRAIVPHAKHRHGGVERNYAYFQDFVPGNDFDIRVVTIGNRAFAIKRHTRDGDFRASGSGRIAYDMREIPVDCIALSFKISDRLAAQSMAYDYVFRDGEILLVEISYAFSVAGYRDCPGFWDRKLNWHEDIVRPEAYMIEDVLTAIGHG
ncbi:MAG TPA: hypothetical protein VN034_00865 [Sphingopyxis sp.]|nr:hypothetical protein [Sphingopyxis sp.]